MITLRPVYGNLFLPQIVVVVGKQYGRQVARAERAEPLDSAIERIKVWRNETGINIDARFDRKS